MTSRIGFEQCHECAAKPGMPVLCESCRLRRAECSPEGKLCGCYLLWDMDSRHVGHAVRTDIHERCGLPLGPLQKMRRKVLFCFDR